MSSHESESIVCRHVYIVDRILEVVISWQAVQNLRQLNYDNTSMDSNVPCVLR
jgi:hypothetical protein